MSLSARAEGSARKGERESERTMALSLACLSPVLPSKNRSWTSRSASSTIPPSRSTARLASSCERRSSKSGARNAARGTRTRTRGGAAGGSDSTWACVPDGGGSSASPCSSSLPPETDEAGVARTIVGRLAVEAEAVEAPLRSAPSSPAPALGGDAARAGVPGDGLAAVDGEGEEPSARPPACTIMSSWSSHAESSKRSGGAVDERASSFARSDASIKSL